MADVGATGPINWLSGQIVGKAYGQGNENIVDNKYVPELKGADPCNPSSMLSFLGTTDGRREVVRHLLQNYFLGFYREREGTYTFDTSRVHYPVKINDKEKAAVLRNDKLLDNVFEIVAKANTGNKDNLYFNLFDQDGEVNSGYFDYGSYLYSCGAQQKVKGKNPNADAIGYLHALLLKPATLSNMTAGSLPPRQVPVTEIIAVINKSLTQPAAPQPAANVAPPVITGIRPAAVTVGTGAKSVVIKGANLEGAQLSVTDDNCKDAITMESIKNETITLRILTGTLEGAPKKCNISVANPAGEVSTDLGVKNKGTGKPKSAGGSDVCKTNPEVCL